MVITTRLTSDCAMRSPCGRLAAAVTAAAGLTGHAGGGHAIHHRYSAARQHYVKTALSGPEVTTVKHWLRWSARHKWVSRSLARDEWIARTSDDQIVLNVTACKLALTPRAHDFLTANDGPNFLRAARALSVHVPPMQRVADVSERIEDLSDVPDATRDERRAIRDAARQKNEETPVTPWRDHAATTPRGIVTLAAARRSAHNRG